MSPLNLCELAFLCGYGAGICSAFILAIAAWSMLDAVAAWDEGGDE